MPKNSAGWVAWRRPEDPRRMRAFRDRIEWCRFRANVTGAEKDVEEGFALIVSYAGEIHATTIAETGRWGETALRELAKYRKQVESKGGGASS